MRYAKWIVLLVMVMLIGGQVTAAPDETQAIRYGISVSEFGNVYEVDDLGLSWAKVYGVPTMRLPSNILYRYDVSSSNVPYLPGLASSIGDIASQYGENIEAYQIGNEPNLHAEWLGPPLARDYVDVLCTAYDAIKANDPTAIVVSAGLATTGRIPGRWGGHTGHNGINQDERQYLMEFLNAGGAECADAIGYNALGFRAQFDANPDEETTDPDTNCGNGFCFRTIEKIRAVLVARGYEDKQIWATEVGWITTPPSDCLDLYQWNSRSWQTVSDAEQAANIIGAIEYAENNYDWMGALFVWNLDFNQVQYDECEQMRFYGVMERSAFVDIASSMGNAVPLTTTVSEQTATASPHVMVVAAVLTLIVVTTVLPKSTKISE